MRCDAVLQGGFALGDTELADLLFLQPSRTSRLGQNPAPLRAPLSFCLAEFKASIFVSSIELNAEGVTSVKFFDSKDGA